MSDNSRSDESDATKRGARHSTSDQEHLNAAAEHIFKAGGSYDPHAGSDRPAVLAPSESAPDAGKSQTSLEESDPRILAPAPADVDVDTVAIGGSVKALGDGRVAGYLVRFGSPNRPDLAGDFFAADTDFGSLRETDAYYHHGLDAKIGKRVVGHGSLKVDDIGVWIDAQLNMRDEYERAIYGLAQAGKLGWSSGTASHLIERESVPGTSVQKIKRWPLGLDASLTVSPCEPANDVIVPMKSLPLSDLSIVSGGTAPDGANDTTDSARSTRSNESQSQSTRSTGSGKGSTMSNEPTDFDLLRAEIAAVKSQNAELLAELRKPALSGPAQVTVTDRERPFKTLADQMFAIRDVATHNATEQQVNRLAAVKAEGVKALGNNESAGAEGGFLVQTEFASSAFERSYATGQITARCTRQAIGAGFNGVKIPAIDEQSRADGSRWGGIRAYWAAEASSVTATKPNWRMITIELKKLMCVIYGSDELMQDTVAYQSYLDRVVPSEMAFKIEDAILRGPGGGIPLGILNAPCLVSVSKEGGQGAATIQYENVYKMWSRMWAGGQGPNIAQGTAGSMSATVWLVNQDCLPALYSMKLPVGVAGSAVFLPPSGAAGSPYATLFGRPVIPVEQCSTLGTVGDIVLCDLSQYALADKGGPNAQVSIHVAFLTDETAFRWTFRTDGVPLWNTALTPYQGTATQSPFVALATRA